MDSDDLSEDHLKMMEINKAIWDAIIPHTKNEEDIVLTSAVLLKSAIQLYTLSLQDEEIEEMLTGYALDAIPALRESFDFIIKRTIN